MGPNQLAKLLDKQLFATLNEAVHKLVANSNEQHLQNFGKPPKEGGTSEDSIICQDMIEADFYKALECGAKWAQDLNKSVTRVQRMWRLLRPHRDQQETTLTGLPGLLEIFFIKATPCENPEGCSKAMSDLQHISDCASDASTVWV